MRILVTTVVLALLAVPMVSIAVIDSLSAGFPVEVGTTPVMLRDLSRDGKPLTGHRFVRVCNDRSSLVEVFVGGAGVSSSTGMWVEPGLCWYSGDRLAQSVTVWAVTASGTATVRVGEDQ